MATTVPLGLLLMVVVVAGGVRLTALQKPSKSSRFVHHTDGVLGNTFSIAVEGPPSSFSIMETILQINLSKERISQSDLSIKNLLKQLSSGGHDDETLIDLNKKISELLQNTQRELSDLRRLIRGIERETEIRAAVEKELEWIQNQYEINMELAKKYFKSGQKVLQERNRNRLFELRNRHRNDSNAAGTKAQINNEMRANQATALTDNIYSVSRMLAAEVERSGRNLDTLVSSSALATETAEELKMMNNHIGNSATLLSKYGRREMTDKILTALGFLFFFGCVIYVLVKRLYLNR